MNMRKSPAVKLAISVLFMFVFALPVFSMAQREKNEALIMAAHKANDSALVESLLAEGANPNYREPGGRTAAHWAAEGAINNTDILPLLAEAGCRFNIIDDYGDTPLSWAINRVSADGFRFILDWEQKNSPNFKGGYSTRRDYIASLFSKFRSFISYELVDILIETGEDLSGVDRNKRSLVWHIAGLMDNSGLSIIERLIAMGIRLDNVDKEGVSPLFNSAEKNNDEVFLTILRWENEYSPAFAGNMASRDEYLASILFSLFEKSDSTALIRVLLEHGMNPNFTDAQGRTALMYTSELEYIRTLLDYDADPTLADKNGQTALHHLEFNMKIAQLLIGGGADVNAADSYGMTPLMVEVTRDNRSRTNENINEFLSMGADPLKKTRSGKNLLLLYMENHSLEKYEKNQAHPTTVELLMNLGLNPIETDNSGNSALSTSFRYVREMSDSAIAIQEMFLAVATEQEIAAARGNARGKILPDFTQSNSKKLVQTSFALMPLGYLGLSIWAREGIYRDNPQANGIGSFNTFATGILAGAALSSLPFLLWIAASDGMDRILPLFFGAIIVPITAIVTGIVWASKLDYRSAFKEYGGLYYIFPAVMGVITIPLLTIIW